MQLTEDMRFRRIVAGYRGPDDSQTCQCCGAAIRQKAGKSRSVPWWCRRHRIWVNARGVCPRFSEEVYNPVEIAEQDDFDGLLKGAN